MGRMGEDGGEEEEGVENEAQGLHGSTPARRRRAAGL